MNTHDWKMEEAARQRISTRSFANFPLKSAGTNIGRAKLYIAIPPKPHPAVIVKILPHSAPLGKSGVCKENTFSLHTKEEEKEEEEEEGL